MPAVNDVGEPCEGKPHARIDGGRLETDRATVVAESGRPRGTGRVKGPATYSHTPPRQSPTLRSTCGHRVSHLHRQAQGSVRVAPVCEVLQVAPSTSYNARSRVPSPRRLCDGQRKKEIERVCEDTFGVYGARKVWRQLHRERVAVARCTVERLMGEFGLAGAVRGGVKRRTTVPDPAAERSAGLVKRDYAATTPNRLWVVDLTCVATWSGTAYVAFVTDVFSRMIVGWRLAAPMRADLPLDALEMAIWARHHRLSGLLHHCDRGSQCTSIRYAERLVDAGAIPSVGSVGDSYDNALAESVNGLCKTGWSKAAAPGACSTTSNSPTLEWVDWYNHRRRHSGCGDVPPAAYEAAYYCDPVPTVSQ